MAGGSWSRWQSGWDVRVAAWSQVHLRQEKGAIISGFNTTRQNRRFVGEAMQFLCCERHLPPLSRSSPTAPAPSSHGHVTSEPCAVAFPPWSGG
eukprot:3937035-Rhodomonas_salina.1